jgi:hypothetical protein
MWRALGRALVLLALGTAAPAMADEVRLFDGKTVAAVIHDSDRTLGIAGQLLGRDLTALTGQAPKVSARLSDCGQVCVVIGRYDSRLVRQVARDADVDVPSLRGQWERYDRVVVRSKRSTYLLIAGSDTRGAIWGVIDLTREMGVSAWEWWADVTPRKVEHVSVGGDHRLSETPSVQYRGIFLNDEDWGLQPWAAKTYEPETGDIGPKTYARIFELMWRLKANTLWPAMHDSTRPFYQIRGNAEMAQDYAIVMGTSHAEPMMRNNVREWDDKTRGEFNFFTNRDTMVRYWNERAKEVKGFDNIYSLGLRGKHDSGMEGARTPEQARDALTHIFAIQRGLLSKAQAKPAEQIPQVLTLYKEVLDIYKTGLKVPDDVTLIWPEDNYGYINQLPTLKERKRSGGSGVYYHISYWGRPHDYLWLGTTHPALIREQMDRAYRMEARKIWIVNVGDIKPAEYLTQYFLDLAFDHKAFDVMPRRHLKAWMRTQFGAEAAEDLAAIMTEFYDLAWERRPEFMGFGQTEPTRPNNISDYIRTGGDEAARRIARYQALTERAERLGATLPTDRQDAYFQLVLYPVRAAASLNERILKLDLAVLYAKQGRANVNALSDEAKAAHARIVADTAAYNAQNGGKWRWIMDMAPRRLPVFDEPFYPQWPLPAAPRRQSANAKAAANRTISLTAASQVNADWEIVPGLGSRGGALRSGLGLATMSDATGHQPLVYDFNTGATADAKLKIVAVPAHPLTSANGLKLAVRLDGGPVQMLDFETFGRSEEWKQNVLTNTAVRTLPLSQFAGGKHQLEIYALDPGFLLDRIDLQVDGAPDTYGAPF